jgi:hypothetical protein
VTEGQLCGNCSLLQWQEDWGPAGTGSALIGGRHFQKQSQGNAKEPGTGPGSLSWQIHGLFMEPPPVTDPYEERVAGSRP